MARVSVDQKALTDSRFTRLGRLIGADRFAAIGRMIGIWNEAQERGQYELTAADIADIHPDLAELSTSIVAAGLARTTDAGSLYICGTRGRIEWLEKKREAARQNGKNGGRPKNPGTDTETNTGSQTNQDRFPQETTPALALALVPALNSKDSSSGPQAEADTVSGLDEDVEAAASEYNRLAAAWSRPKITKRGLRSLGPKLVNVRKAIRVNIPDFTLAETVRRIRDQEEFFRYEWRAWSLAWLAQSKDDTPNAEKTWNRIYARATRERSIAQPFTPAMRKTE